MDSVRSRVDRAATLLAGKVVAAALTPFTAEGQVDYSAIPQYVDYLENAGVGGLAVGVHTGRGAMLDLETRGELIRQFRAATALPIVAGATAGSAPRGVRKAALRAELGELEDAGADAFLIVPPRGASGDETVEFHRVARASTDAPLIGFALYESASQNQYDASLAERLMDVGIDAIKLAYLRDSVASYDTAAALRRRSDCLVISGEDRMLPASLIWGCDGLLVGIAAALPALTVRMYEAFRTGDLEEFARATDILDRFAALVFRAPMDGYIARLGWAAKWDAALPAKACFDPYGDPTVLSEYRAFRADVEALGVMRCE